MSPLEPPLRALEQLDDPTLLRVVGWSVLAAVAGFVLMGAGVWWGARGLLGLAGWVSGVVGAVGSAVLAYYLFLPVAGGIASLFCDPIAAAVERRYYPATRQAAPASLREQAWDGMGLGLRVLGLQILALLFTPALPGLSVLLAYAVAAWAIGRGLFVAVAMRHMDRRQAITLYSSRRVDVLIQGALAVAASLVPVLNLLVPVLAVVAMVHVLHRDASPGPGLARSRGV